MPDVIQHPEAEGSFDFAPLPQGERGAWMPAYAGMTGGYTASLLALGAMGRADSMKSSAPFLKQHYCAVALDRRTRFWPTGFGGR